MEYKSFSTVSSKASSSGMLYGIEVIKEDILRLLLTRKGDYPQDPSIGVILHDYVFAPTLNADEEAEIKDDILEQLERDQRISNVRVFIENSGVDVLIAIYADIVGIDEELFLAVPIKEV